MASRDTAPSAAAAANMSQGICASERMAENSSQRTTIVLTTKAIPSTPIDAGNALASWRFVTPIYYRPMVARTIVQGSGLAMLVTSQRERTNREKPHRVQWLM